MINGRPHDQEIKLDSSASKGGRENILRIGRGTLTEVQGIAVGSQEISEVEKIA